MKAQDVTETIEEALQYTSIPINNRPRLLSDNGSCYISSELADYLGQKNMSQVRGRPLHPQIQDKIERYHRSMMYVVKLDNYFSPGQLESKMKKFVIYYNHKRYHEALNNLTPADVYFGKAERKFKARQKVKQRTLKQRKIQNQEY